MKLFETDKIARANRVLAALRRRCKGTTIGKSFYQEMYCNGREQGYCISGFSTTIAFAENRNSDDIVVYVGKQGDFNMQGNIPSETVYQSRKYFKFNEHEEAALYIYGLLFADEASGKA